MFFDLNVPVPSLASNASKKGKTKQIQPSAYTPAQLTAIDAKLDILIHLGYTVIAFNQTVHKKIDPKLNPNILDPLLAQLNPRPGIVFLKRLTIILDEDSEKGFGLITAHAPFFNTFHLLSLVPTTQTTFSLACLTHSLPSSLTAHIISLPLTLPRLGLHLKHTLIRTAIKNGAVFEIGYSGALGGTPDPVLADAGAAESGANAKRNWWASAREVVRVTKGKSILVSGGVVDNEDLRAPRDVANLVTLLGLPQDVSHGCLTNVPKSLVLPTRQTYRAVLSEPILVIPEGFSASAENPPAAARVEENSTSTPSTMQGQNKRPRDETEGGGGENSSGGKKKKRKKNNNLGVAS